jgi:hypothetical protein
MLLSIGLHKELPIETPLDLEALLFSFGFLYRVYLFFTEDMVKVYLTPTCR